MADSREIEVELDGGVSHSSDGSNYFRLSISDEASHVRIISFKLTAEEWMKITGGSMGIKVKAEWWPWAEHVGMKRLRHKLEVPSHITFRQYDEKKWKAAAEAWFEDQPGSAMVDGYSFSREQSGQVYVHTYTFVDPDVFDAAQRLAEESTEIDLDADE